MNLQQAREISTGALFRMGLPACISIGLLVGTIMSDGTLPMWLKAGVGAISLSISGLSVFALVVEYKRQEADLDLERKAKEARLPRQANIPTKPPDPRDGGETPTPEFLGVVWETWRNSTREGKIGTLPPVRADAFAKLGLNPSRVQAMYTRCATWGMIVGRVQGGAAGVIAEGWTHVQARQYMTIERPEYGVSVKA